MNDRPGRSGRSGDRNPHHYADDQPTEVMRDPYDYFYGPAQPREQPPPQRPRSRPAPAPPPGPRRRGGIGRKILAVLGVILLLVAGVLVYVDLELTKVDALQDYEGRPPPSPGQNWLLVGSDSRGDLTAEQRQELNTGHAGGQRTDTIMLLHIPRFGGEATLVSLPRDSAVDIPAYTSEDGESVPAQRNKLNAAFAFGGPQLLARTVETETGIRLDEYMEIGLGGFAGMVDAVGGVRMCLDQPMQDRRAGVDLSAGCQQLSGPQALGFVRARYSDPEGDLGRVERQQRFLGALSDEVSRPGTLLNPIVMTRLLGAGTDALVVDEGTGPPALLWFAWQMKGLAGGSGSTLTVPVAGTGSASGLGSVVRWDREEAVALFDALRQDEPVPESVLPEDQ